MPLFAGGSVPRVADSNSLQTFAYSRDGKYIAAGEFGRTGYFEGIIIYDGITLDKIKILQGHEGSRLISQIDFSPDGIHIASCSDDKILVHEIETGKSIFSLIPKNKIVTSISYRFDGQRLVSGVSGLITIWDAVTGKEIMTLQAPQKYCETISYSPDGNKILSAFEYSFKIWDANFGTELMEITEQNMFSVSASYSPDGTKIIAGYSGRLGSGNEQIIKIYDSYNYDVLYSYIIGYGSINNALFAQYNNYILISYTTDDTLPHRYEPQIIIMNSCDGNIIDIIRKTSNHRFSFAINYSGTNIVFTENYIDIKLYIIN